MNTTEPVSCAWCSHPVHGQAARCAHCGLDPSPAVPARAGEPVTHPDWPPVTAPVHPVIGVDPGARHTGIVVRDRHRLLRADTLRRESTQSAWDWARHVTAHVNQLRDDVPAAAIAVETVVAPTGFRHGEQHPINPGPLVDTAIVVGALTGCPGAVPVAPARHGTSVLHGPTPAALAGRRPTDLPGRTCGGSRRHEQSAWAIAGRIRSGATR